MRRKGPISLYWLNPDSLTIQSAGSGRIASGHAENIGAYGEEDIGCLKMWYVLDGNAADGSVEAVASGSGRRKRQLGEMVLPNPPEGVPDPARYTASASGNRQTSGSQSTAASADNSSGSSGQTVMDAATEGIMSQAELESIQGDRSRNSADVRRTDGYDCLYSLP